MVLLLVATALAEPCRWEAEDLAWTWHGQMTLVEAGGVEVVNLRPATFDHVTLTSEGRGLRLEVSEGPVTVRGAVGQFWGLHPVESMEIGDGLTLGPWASVSLDDVRRGRGLLWASELAGVRPYAPYTMPSPRVRCTALTLSTPPGPEVEDLEDPHLLQDATPVIVYDAPNGRALGEYAAGVSPTFDYLWAPEGDDRVVVMETRDGFTRILDDRLSWRLEGWVREADVLGPPQTALLGGRGYPGRRTSTARICLSAGPLFVINDHGDAYEVGELRATGQATYGGAESATGLLRVHFDELWGVFPGPPSVGGWFFAVQPAQRVDCPAGP